MSEYSICHYPYTSIQINEKGDVHPCCHPWCSFYSFGNILEQPFEEIWNGEKAQEFRKQFLNDDFKYCQLDTCINGNERQFKTDLIAKDYPDVIALSYDRVCNVQCIFCRDCRVEQDLSVFDNKIDEWLPDVFKNAERVSLSGVGEALASKHTRNVMKKIANLYPKVKFDILTNGVLMDERNLSELNIKNNLGVIRFSFHAIKKGTYNKLVNYGNFDRIMKNIEYIAQLQEQGLVQQLEFRFVINALNYKEMVDFAKMAKKYKANVTFLNLLSNEGTMERFDELNVINPKHPKHKDFKKVLTNPIFREPFIFINKDLLENNETKSSNIFLKWFKKN